MTNNDWVVLGVLSTAASAIVASYMAYLTRSYVLKTTDMVAEMTKTREESLRPYVVVSLDVEGKSSVYLVVQNIGQTTANNLVLEFEQELKNMHHENIKELAFVEPIQTLVPGWKYKTAIGPSWEITEENGYNMHNKVVVSYQSVNASMYKETYILNFPLIRSRRWLEESVK